MLEFKDVSIEYKSGTTALNSFNLTVEQGKVVSLVGESGSGKTTAIRAAIGLLPIGGVLTAGDILLDGISIKSLSKKEWQSFRGNKISMIFQDSGAMLNPVRSIGSQFVEYIKKHDNISTKNAYDKAVNLLQILGLYDGDAIMKSIPSNLSGGMRQRVGIAMAIAFNPSIILADEPTSALDVTIAAQIVKQLMQLQKNYNTSILMVTHNIGVAAYMSDEIVVMKSGNIIEKGSRDEIINSPKHEYTKKLIKAVPDFKGERYV